MTEHQLLLELAWFNVQSTNPARPSRQERIDHWYKTLEDVRYIRCGYPQGGEQWDKR